MRKIHAAGEVHPGHPVLVRCIRAVVAAVVDFALLDSDPPPNRLLALREQGLGHVGCVGCVGCVQRVRLQPSQGQPSQGHADWLLATLEVNRRREGVEAGVIQAQRERQATTAHHSHPSAVSRPPSSPTDRSRRCSLRPARLGNAPLLLALPCATTFFDVTRVMRSAS